MSRISNIINHYKRWKANNPDLVIEYAVQQNSIVEVIKVAALCRDANGKKHPHQYRLKQDTLDEFADALVAQNVGISQTSNFPELITLIHEHKVKGIGELTVYDTAVRIGAYLDIWPDQIYLHAGARVGAEAIIGEINSDTILLEDLPAEFVEHDVSCYEAEDILCIYKKPLSRHRQQRVQV